MPDEKRIKDFEPATELLIDDWFAVDSPSQGTRKMQASMFQEGLQTQITANTENIALHSGQISVLQQGVGNIGDKVDVLDAAITVEEYSASKLYAVDEDCVYEGVRYKCITAIESPEAFTPSHWQAISIEGELNELNSSLTTISIGINNLITAGAFNVQYASANKSGNVLTLVTLMRAKGQNVSAGTPLAIIKSGYRPKQDLYIPVADNNSISSYLKILANGNIVSDLAYTTTHTSLLIITTTYII